jgi:hypothetical protein
MSKIQLAILLDAMYLMAAPASVQIQPGQVSADEVALEWDNAWHVAKGLCEERVIPAEIYNAVTQLNHELGAIEPSSNFWSDDALQSDDRWENFRVRAQAIVAQLTAMKTLKISENQ